MASRNHPERISNYCCFLQSVDAGTHGSGIIVKFEGLQNANLLALNWRKRDKIGKLETDYALVTSHDTIPGLSGSELNHWIVSCQGIENGRKKETLSNIVCGVISCCGPESLFAGHTADATVTVFRSHHGNAGCDIQLNITILFLNRSFEDLLQGSTVFPPVIPVNEYLDQNTYTQKHRPIINTGRNSSVSYMYCDRIQSVKTALFSVVEQQRTLEHEQELTWEFERFQKLESSSTMEICHGSPVYLNPDTNTNEPLMIGVYVGRTSQKGEQLVVTFHGILRLLQGGLIPVLSVLRCMEFPKAWTGRWGYLVTPHIDQMKRMQECSYVCEVLHFLLRERYGSPLVPLPVHLVDVDNEASLDLLCALFKHFESADNAVVNKAVIKLNLENEMNAYITQLCKDVIHLLELGANMVTDRTSLVEKCLNFYNRLLDFKYAGITKQVLCTPQNLELLKHILKRYKQSAAVQKNVIDIIFKRYPLSDKKLLALVDQILPQDVVVSLQQSGLDLKTSGNPQGTLEELQHETVSRLRQLLDLALENHLHYEAYQKALKEGVAIPLKYLKVLFFGPPRTGKTSMRRRLVREIKNLRNEPVQASTGTAEHYDVIVKVVDDKTTNSPAIITNSEWSNVKALFSKEKGSHETDLDEELQLLYQFIYEDVSQTENTSPINRPELNDSRSPVSTPVTEKEAQDKVTQQSPAREKTDTDSDESHETDPNASISTPQVSSVRELSAKQMEEVVREHGLSAEEKKEIEEAFEAFNKILRTGGREQLKVLLEGTILMNMVDTGGHPAFLEMLPAMTMGPALYLIFFRLNQELKKRYQIQYVSEDNEEIQLGESSYTVEEVIFQALSSISCFSCTASTNAKMPNPSNAAVLVATHKDLLGSDPQAKIKAKDNALQENLQEILDTDLVKSHKNFLHFASDDQLIFAIDNMTGDDSELKEVCKRLEDIINQEFDNFPIPASWLMFSIFLRKMGNRTMSLLKCHEIGERLEVRDTDEALWFLHHCVGILMHFPKIEEIKDVVICDPQVVFDSVTDLILNSFRLTKVSKFACDKFKETGQFRFSDIQTIAKCAKWSKNDSLPLPKLVKLLEHLNIIAPIKPGSSSPESDACQEVYFMPAVLEHAKDEELHMKQNSTDPVPLMIHFKCGFVPVGVFCAMIASLVFQEDTLRWKLLKPRDGYILSKNKVTFRINGAIDITLISKPKRYEVHIARISTTDKTLEEICQHVLETVCDILDQVISKMKYKQYLMSSHTDATLYELGFKCPKHSNDDHLVINRLKSRVEVPSQSAKPLWLYYLQRKSTMICLKEGISIDLQDKTLSPFARQSLVWFGEATEISRTSIPVHPPDITQNPENQSVATGADIVEASGLELNLRNIVNVLHDAGFSDGHWEQLGQQLIEYGTLATFRENRHGDSSLCMSDTISQWLNNDLDKSWEKLAEAVSWVKEYGQATADCVKQKAGIVHKCTTVTPEKQKASSPTNPTVDRQRAVVTHKAESLQTPAPSTPASTTVDILGRRKQKPSNSKDEDIGILKKTKLKESKGSNWKLPCGIITGVLVVLFGIVIWWLLARNHQSIVSYLPGELQLKFDDRPTLPTLRDFPGRDRSIDIAANIGTDYSKLGTLLLDDYNGKKVKNIKKSKLGDPIDIAVAILKVWIEGKGRTPVTWQTLVTCLRKTDLNVLADDIETVLSEHKDSDHEDL